MISFRACLTDLHIFAIYMSREPDHYHFFREIVRHIAEVKQVTCGGWKAVVFLLKLLVLLYSFLHHSVVSVADGSDDDITQALLQILMRETHPWNIRAYFFARTRNNSQRSEYKNLYQHSQHKPRSQTTNMCPGNEIQHKVSSGQMPHRLGYSI